MKRAYQVTAEAQANFEEIQRRLIKKHVRLNGFGIFIAIVVYIFIAIVVYIWGIV